MNQEITIDDYKKIGTMETALSEHADEAFSELSPERQKIAEKIFKCLTETDRENREIRRATTVEKLCAIAEADFSEVASVIEVFRKEGRTFLMPPPDVQLNEHSLIDISHESLIRKWERLKNWVEEEGQSSRTYRRLAEDALLNQQGKMGFWSDPELKDALEWRENFKPNETWAQLYKETGERQYKASFADAMRYLDESEINRDEEIAEDTRQRETLRKNAKNLRRLAYGLAVISVLMLGAAVFAFYQMNKSIQATNALEAEKTTKDKLNLRLMDEINFSEIARKDKEKAFDELNVKTKELESKKEELSISLDKQEEATEKAEKEKERAETEKERADEEAQQAKLSEAEKQKALERQKQLKNEADIAKDDAINKKEEAELALERAASTTKREELNRTGLVLLEQGEFKQALKKFDELLKSYENQNELMTIETRTDGRWWAAHNLGIVNSKLDNFIDAEKFYKYALRTLGESSGTVQSQSSRQYFQLVSYQTRAEVNRNKVTTLRRLAQLYRAQAENVATDKEWKDLLVQAVEKYKRLLEILKLEAADEKQPSYPADVYVELADCLSDLPEPDDFERAKELYSIAAATYKAQNDFGKQVDVLRKWADAFSSRGGYGNGVNAFNLLIEAIEIQEGVMNLSPVSLEIANTYAQLAKADELATEGDYDNPMPYAKLSELIGKVNYAANKTYDLPPEDVRELANTYVEIGKCRRAKKVYLYAIDWTNRSEQNTYFHNSFRYLNFYLDLAELYQNVLHDDNSAQKNLDVFVAESEKGKPGRENSNNLHIEHKLFERAGDFYFFSKKDYLQAGKFYEYTLQKIEEDFASVKESEKARRKSNSTIDAQSYDKFFKELTRNKAEILVKTARVDEAQNKFAEAEERYTSALSLAPSAFRALNIPIDAITLRAKILIQQANFYERRGNKQKAQDIYIETEKILSELDSYNTVATQAATNIEDIPALKGIVYKKLGDFNRDNVAIADKFYRRAISNLGWFENSTSKDKYAPYFKNHELNAKYYSDLTEAYEAWISLNGVELGPGDKMGAERVRKKAEELKLKEQKSPCEEK